MKVKNGLSFVISKRSLALLKGMCYNALDKAERQEKRCFLDADSKI